MKIGGFQPMTLSDFPGHVAAMIYTQGCNFRCPFCHNGSLLGSPDRAGHQVPEAHVFDVLRQRAGLLEGLVVSGGEPTLQEDLLPFLRRVRAMGLEIKMDTNGSRPEVLYQLLYEGLVDYIAMDIKAPLPCYERLAGVPVQRRKIQESIELVSQSGVAHEFRTTVVENLLSPADLEAIEAMVPYGSLHKWQKFQPENAFSAELAEMVPSQALQVDEGIFRTQPKRIGAPVPGIR
jgi:pyruvate formate lyase activating enzyme